MVEEVKKLLDNIQQNLFDVAKQKRDECIQVTHTWDEFVQALNQRKMILAPWCDEEVCIVYFSSKYDNPGVMRHACQIDILGILMFESKLLFDTCVTL